MNRDSKRFRLQFSSENTEAHRLEYPTFYTAFGFVSQKSRDVLTAGITESGYQSGLRSGDYAVYAPSDTAGNQARNPTANQLPEGPVSLYEEPTWDMSGKLEYDNGEWRSSWVEENSRRPREQRRA